MSISGLGTSQLTSGSSADASNLTTLCYVGGANPEYVSFTTATLTGTGAYNLAGMVRGAYSTINGAHVAGDAFVRVDSAIVVSDDMDLSMVGKSIYVKICSFNQYGGAQQSLADVNAVIYTITGYMAKLPPTAPTSFAASLELYGVRLVAGRSPDLDVTRYEYRLGSTWSSSTLLEGATGTSYLWQVQNVGTYTFWVAAVDAYGAYSTPVSCSITVGAGTVTGLSQYLNAGSIVLTWNGVLGAFANAGYEVRWGASFAAGASLGLYNVNTYTEQVRWGGTRMYWVAPIDVKGNYGTAVSVSVAIAPPGAISGQRADVVDNNVLLYWNPPSTGVLPVDHYEVRKGTDWATATVVGSNASSTFAAVFEQVSGTYTYWFAAVDTAGTYGTPASLSATVSQPPDYVLKVNYDSTFAGTLTKMYVENGAMIGPVDLTQTWASHYTTNGWTTPAAQVAAGYSLYAEPAHTSLTCSYQETFDYGTTLSACIITITPTYTVLDGTVAAACQIYSSTDGTTWTTLSSGFSALATSFRYVKYLVKFTGGSLSSLVKVTNINVKLNTKQRTDSGAGTSNSTGVTVNFNYPFIDADTPFVQANGLDTHSKPWVAAVEFTDVPNPTSFIVHIYDSTGVQTSGVSFSWTARGY
jgi:hypothetical protein